WLVLLDCGHKRTSIGSHIVPVSTNRFDQALEDRFVSQSPTRISSRTSHPSCEQHDGSGIEERCCGGDCSLEVLGETAVAPEPGEETLYHPAAWMHGKADLAGLFAHDLDDDPGGVRHSFGGIGAISEGTLDERIQRAGRP